MIKINIKAIIAREAERKVEVKPLPKVIISGSDHVGIKPTMKKKSVPENGQQSSVVNDKDILLKDLNEQLKVIKISRAKLSTRTSFLVDEVAEKLGKESAGMAKAFLDGELPSQEIAEHYAKIQACTEQAIVIWDQIRYVEQYGKLPELPALELPQSNPDADAIRHEIRRLDDLIHKCNKKIEQATGGLKKPKNSERINTWKEKISMAEAKRDRLKHDVKKKQYVARAERSGEE